jgi:penicillin-binding protein 1A
VPASSRKPRSDDVARAVYRRRLRRNAKRRPRRLAVVLSALLVIGAGAVTAGAVTAVALVRTHCDLDVLRPVGIGQNTFVYAADGTSLGSIPAERNRQPVPLVDVSPWMRRATIAVEDRRFYRHSGVDYEGIARALWRDLTEGEIVEGGSTLTQQLVRNLYISRERTVTRKLREACLAVQLNRDWSKQRILRAWLNIVYFGNRAYGVEAAAQTYFSKPARDLNLREAALLAGLPQAPSTYDPFADPAAALARRNVVLQAMLDNGDITRTQYRWAVRSSDLRLRPGELYSRIREPYFFGYVRDELIRHYGANTVRSGGLRVYTTINPRFQRAAEISIRESLDQPGDPASALVSINPANGAIRAMTAVTPGRKYEFNFVAQARRQAGSTFKMFVLATAVLKHIDPSSTFYVSAPYFYQPDPSVPAWEVSTYDHSYSGWTSIENATIRSDNSVFAQLTVDVGPENVAATARRMGVRTPLLAVPSLGLGSIAISPLDLASGYTTLAGRGIYSRPMAIRKVILPGDRGEDTSAGWGEPRRRRVMSEEEAYVITKILEENVQYGTGTGAAFGRPAAGKTGTTDDHADAWFAGYTPDLTTVVWVGYPQGEIPMESVHGISVSGGSFPAEIWRLFMERALGESEPLEWVVPADLPEWEPWERGEDVLSYDPYAKPEKTEETTTVNEPAELPPPPPPPVIPD